MLDTNIAICKHIGVTCSCNPSPDPTLAVAERQLAMLGELAQMAMVVTRANAAASVAAGHAVEVILADEFWQPETGRARALAGAKDAADSFQKVSRALRLTLRLEMAAAEAVRDIRAGLITHTAPRNAGEMPADLADTSVRRDRAGADSDGRDTDAGRGDSTAERLVDIERPDTLPQTPFRATVDRICSDLNAPVDWTTWKVGPPILEYAGLQPKPPGWSECKPPASYARPLEPAPPIVHPHERC